MPNKIVAWTLAACLAVGLGSACAASGSDHTFDDPGPGADEADAAGGTNTGSGSMPPGSNLGGSSGGDTSPDAAQGTCAAETQSAKQLPLDIFIMLDASGSMMEETAGSGTPTKWTSVKDALKGFIGDAKSAGIGVGLQVFPITHPGAPSSCTSNAQCTAGGVSLGRCFLKACEPVANQPLVSCDSTADCGGAACRQLGECVSGPPPIYISMGGCLVGDACFPGFSCEAITANFCDRQECVTGDYAKASVPIATLPGNATTLTSKIDSLADPPQAAMTPTSAALEGGLTYAKQFATANSGHAVVLVLATDGVPTRCSPMDAAGIAAIAASSAGGTPSIKTFSIGVFTDASATASLDAIAQAGGTTQAIQIKAGSNVTTEFQAALAKIRAQALPCEYTVPKPEAGTPDYGAVNVQFTPTGSASVMLGYKASAAACDSSGGWYYDLDPASGATPTKISLCPASCDAVKKDTTSAKVDILLGCKTIVK